jgi:hypothetical protein
MDRFEFEQQIMNSWHTVDDIGLFIESLKNEDNEFNREDIISVLSGIKKLHDMRCEVMFNTFEKLIENGNCK